MSLVSDIIRDGYRESNINAIGVSPTAVQQDEALRLLNRLVASSYGNEEGDLLQPFPIGRNDVVMPPGYPWYDQTPPGNFTIPANSRMMCNLEKPQTLYLNPAPEDGERFAVVDTSNNFATENLTLVGNGRQINGALSLVANTNGYNQEFFYRDDLGDWLPILPLAYTDEFPYPSDFDDYFIISLAMRLNPRNGAPLDPQSQRAWQQARSGLNSRYQQIRPTPSELALIRTPGTWPAYYRGLGGSFANSMFNSGYGFGGGGFPWNN